jgi:MerR family transcriptional regulator, copper efflux regulator
MRIGEIARKARVSKSIIRYYERKGILPCPMRNSSGYRDYGAADLDRIQVVAAARRLGCTFSEIMAIISMRETQSDLTPHFRQLVDYKVVEVGEEIDRLRIIQAELLRLQQIAPAEADA